MKPRRGTSGASPPARSSTRMLVALLLPVLLCAAQDAPPAAPPAAQPFDIQLLPVRADAALDAWHRVPARFTPQFAPVGRIHPGERVLLLVPLIGLTRAAQGDARVTLDVEQRRADGTVGGLGAGLVAWDGPPPAPGIAVLSRDQPGLSFGADEPLGPVRIRVRATDVPSGATVERSAELQLVAWSYGDLPADQAGFERFCTHYHRAPEPGQAVRAFLDFAALERPDGTLDLAITGFFLTLFRDQPWLVDHLIATARGGDTARLKQATVLLHLLGLAARIAELHPDDPARGADARGAVSGLRLPDPYGPPESGAQLELLWGEYFASARWRPVRRIVSALEQPPGPDPATRLRVDATQAAADSLEGNIVRHPLVAQYVVGMLEDEHELDARTRALLGAIFERAAERRRAEGHDAAHEGDGVR